MSGLTGAFQFLTIIQIRTRQAPSTSRSVPWFPTVGAVVGAVAGLATAGLMEVVPPSVAATIGVLVGVAITGAFHEDGLADSADALGGATAERRREILKDSRHGSFGVIAMIGTILLRVACVASMGPAVAFAALVSAHTLGRAGAVGLMITGRSAPGDGLGADYLARVRPRSAFAGIVAGAALATVALGWWVAPALGAVAGGAVLVGLIAARLFGGLSGDLLGACEQVGECACLVVVAGLATHHRLWWS